MANENNNINELVSAEDDDPTAELEVPNFKDRDFRDVQLESNSKTFDATDGSESKRGRKVPVLELESDLLSSNKTIGRLQFDIEQLHARWRGLESEIKARENQTVALNEELAQQKYAIDRSERLVSESDEKIQALEAELRQRDDEHRALLAEVKELQQALSVAEEAVSTAEAERAAAAEVLEELARSKEHVESMESQNVRLDKETSKLSATLERKEKMLKSRDENINALKSEIKQRDNDHRALVTEFADLQQTLGVAEKALATAAVERDAAAEVLLKLNQSEEFSDSMQSQIALLKKEMTQQRATIEKSQARLGERDEKIKSLKSDVKIGGDEHTALLTEFSDLQKTLRVTEEESASAAVERSAAGDIQRKLDRSEEYADSIRRQLQDRMEFSDRIVEERDKLAESLLSAVQENDEYSESLRDTELRASQLQTKLDSAERSHADEIRALRFELGEAQDTAVESDNMNNHLASELVDARGSNSELENSLAAEKEEARERVEKLKKEVKELSNSAEQYEEKLTTKSEAIAVLLDELSKKSEELESIDKIENVIQDIDDRMSESFAEFKNDGRDSHQYRDDKHPASSLERTTRLLVGNVDGQVLRFPLFKDRLTVGRSADNDIQVTAAYVSRRHAVIQTDGDSARIIDWGSKNGIYVNSDRVKEHFLNHGDVVIIGHARFRYEERKKRDS